MISDQDSATLITILQEIEGHLSEMKHSLQKISAKKGKTKKQSSEQSPEALATMKAFWKELLEAQTRPIQEAD